MTTRAEFEPSKQLGMRHSGIAVERMTVPALQFLAAIVLAIAAFFAAAAGARAGQNPAPTPVFASPSEARAGSLLLKTEDGRYADAPRLGTDIDITVSGPTIRARVTQVFHNPTENWVEAIYVYPLPHGGAVDTLKMVIGDRIVVGEIKERQQARVQYEQAKRAGQKAALMEQERPNIFTNSVANIGPGETVLVQIEYQEPVHQTNDVFSLRMPLVVGPRYNPAPVVQSVDLRPDGWGQVTSDPVPDRDRITPPGARPGRECAGQSGDDQGAIAGGISARRGQESPSRGAVRSNRRRHARDHIGRRAGAGGPGFRADVAARNDAKRRRSACFASRLAWPTISSSS